MRYYILFANYEQGLALRDILLQDNVPNRIAPAPRAIQGDLSCGMSLLIEPEHLDAAKRSIEAHHAAYDTGEITLQHLSTQGVASRSYTYTISSGFGCRTELCTS